MSEIGHNSNSAVAGDQLRSIVERVERVEGEIADLREDVKEIYAEAKGNGYDVAAIRAMVRFRKMDADKLRARREIEALYWHALGLPEYA